MHCHLLLWTVLQNLAMFLSMLVAWMIPDVPRSLRDQLKKENMMLMEFLLNQDQEARAKSHNPKRHNSCFPTHIDIVVEAPEREQEEVGAEGAEIEACGLRSGGSDSEPELSRSLPEQEESHQEEPRGNDEDEARDGGEKETQVEDNEDEQALEEQQVESEETEDREVKTIENCLVDLDSLMSEMGLLGKKKIPQHLNSVHA